MPAGGAAQQGARGPAAAGAAGEGGMDWKAVIQQLTRSVVMYFFISNITKTLFQPQNAVDNNSRNPTGPSSASPSGDVVSSGAAQRSAAAPSYRGPLYMMWREHDPMALYVYLTEKEEFDWDRDRSSLLWSQDGLTFDWEPSNTREVELNVTLTPHLQNNGSAWAHVIFTRAGAPPNHPDPHTRSYRRFQLNKYRKKKKAKNLKRLLGDDQPSANATANATAAALVAEEEKGSNETTVLSYWKPELSLQLVHHFVPFSSVHHVPGPILQEMDVEEATGLFYPIIYNNDFWLLTEHLIPLNSSLTQVPLKLSYSPIGLIKWQIQLQMDQQFKTQQKMGYSDEGEMDVIRRMFLETNPVLLAVTMVVSCLHMLFDMLAFKNDISFWRKNKSMEGLSLRTILINTFFQAVIFLYLADHDTSWMVLFSSGVGLLIDIWKIHKAFLSSVVWVDEATGRRLAIPRVQFKAVESYSKNKTQQYDEEATSHLMFIIVPLMVGYAAYSLVYERHKSWYSWLLTSLTGFTYVFGFVMMVPQLYINYKLKSVAHLPWRTMVYKSLNTFIDDLFAFIIKMPTMHRLSCFRDDVIFLIYLYQRWIYPVDKKRINEFGQLTEDNKDSAEAKELLEGLTEEEKQEAQAKIQSRLGPTGSETAASEPTAGEAKRGEEEADEKEGMRPTAEPQEPGTPGEVGEVELSGGEARTKKDQ